MSFLRFAGRVTRRMIYETAMDTTMGLAAQMAYQFLFTLAPGLLFLWYLLGLFGTDPAKLHQMLNILKNFLPADPKVQEIIDSIVANIVVTGSTGKLVNVGIFLGIWLGTIFISTISHALSRTHGVVEDRNWWSKYIIAFFLVFWFGITILFCFNAMVFGETLAGVAEVNFQLTIPLQEWVAFLSLPLTALALVGLALALYLLTPENYLTIRQALPGAIFFSIGWILVTKLFQFYVAKYDRYNPTYLALASIIMLMTWMWLTCLLLLLGGKLNAILRRERERAAAREAPRPCHSPRDSESFRELITHSASVTLARRDPTSRFSRHRARPGRDGRLACPGAIDRRREKETGARGNARGHFAHAVGDAVTQRQAETGEPESQVDGEKDPNANSNSESEGKSNGNPGADQDAEGDDKPGRSRRIPDA